MVVKIHYVSTPRARAKVVSMPPRPAARPSPPVPPAVSPEPKNDFLAPHQIAQGLACLLSPVTAAMFALALWRFGQDMGLTRGFFITEGPLSHWQPWLALTCLLFACGIWLNRQRTESGRPVAENGQACSPLGESTPSRTSTPGLRSASQGAVQGRVIATSV